MPAPPAPDELVDAGREVPLEDVFALAEMLVVELAFDSTVVRELAVEEGDSAEVVLAFVAVDVVLVLAEYGAEVEAREEVRATEDGVNSVLVGEDDALAPAPEDDPAVFDVAGEEELPAKED